MLIHLRNWIFTFLIFCFAPSFAQNTIPIDSAYCLTDIVNQEGVLVVELGTADYYYTGQEKIGGIFPGDFEILCAFEDCDPYLKTIDDGDTYDSIPHWRTPVAFRMNSKVKPGNYEIQVTVDNKVIHKRILTIINHVPELQGFEVEYPYDDQSATNDEIKITRGRGLRGARIQLSGPYTNVKYQSVAIEGKSLDHVNGPIYEFGEEWTEDKMLDFPLYEPHLEIERKGTEEKIEIPVKITSDRPEVIANLSNNAVEGVTNYSLKLSVKNLFRDSRLELIHDSSFIETPAMIYEHVNNNLADQAMTFQLTFKRNVQLNGRYFWVRIHNYDGQVSEAFRVDIRADANLVSLAPIDKQNTMIQGEWSTVVFRRLNSARSFPVTGNMKFRIQGFPEQTIQPNRSYFMNPEDAFSADVKMPDNIPSSAQFSIYTDNRYHWTGSISDIMIRPVFKEDRAEVFPGDKLQVGVDHVHDRADEFFKVSLADQNNPNIFLSGKSLSGGVEVTTTTELTGVDAFDIIITIKNREIDRKTILVKDWKEPKYLVLNPDIGFVAQQQKITVRTRPNVPSKELQALKAQLVRENGAKLGTPQLLRASKSGNQYATQLDPNALGVRGGEVFHVEFTNHSGIAHTVQGYMKRHLKEQFKVMAGVSALEIRFKDQGQRMNADSTFSDISQARLLKGVNLGLYWIPETIPANRTSGKRFIGFGMALTAQEQENQIVPRTAFSAILFETLSMGLSFGDNEPAFFIGAHVDFINLANIFRQ